MNDRPVPQLPPEVQVVKDLLVGFRSALGLSQADIAENVGTTQSTISDFERGQTGCRISTFWRYADAVGAQLEISVRWGGWECRRLVPTSDHQDQHQDQLAGEPAAVGTP